MAVQMDYLVSRQQYSKWSYDDMQDVYAKLDKLGVDPPIRSRWDAWLRAEPEFSRRLTPHVTANHLAWVDHARRERPPLLDDDLFDDAAVAVTQPDRLPARRLIELLKDSLLNSRKRALIGNFVDTIDREQARCACLEVALAAQAYYRDHAELPERLADTQPDYLSSLPDDPYAPQPMPVVYRRTGDEAIVYSRFTNETDDGGITVTYDEARGKELRDFGFRIRSPRTLSVVAPCP